MIIINDACRDPREVDNSDATNDTSADESSEEEHYHEGALDVRDPPWVVIYVIIRSWGSVVELKGRTASYVWRRLIGSSEVAGSLFCFSIPLQLKEQLALKKFKLHLLFGLVCLDFMAYQPLWVIYCQILFLHIY